jgi:hypothetical protein
MFHSPLKKLSLIIVIWFALLQVIAPFMHSHAGDEHFTETADLHIHADEHTHNDNATQQNGSYLISNASNNMQTFLVADGLINDVENSLVLFAVLIFLFSFLVRVDVIKLTYPNLNFLHDHSLSRRRPAPRAPPLL